MTTKDERDALRRLDGARTPGFLRVGTGGSLYTPVPLLKLISDDAVVHQGMFDRGVLDFLAAAANAAIPLADEVERLQGRVRVLESLLREAYGYLPEAIALREDIEAFGLAATGRGGPLAGGTGEDLRPNEPARSPGSP